MEPCASEPKRRSAFIYALWSDPNDCMRWKNKTFAFDLQQAALHRLGSDVRIYCWGDRNRDEAAKLGIPAVLVDARENVWGSVYPGSMWRHKIEAWRMALQEYQEVVFLDLDIMQLQPVPSDFWTRLRAKSPFQANLLQYACRKAPWRSVDSRKVPSAAFVYLGHREVPETLARLSDEHPTWTEEIVAAHYTDCLANGWQGVDHWATTHEPYCCLVKRSAMPPEVQGAKEHIFGYR